MDKDLVVSLNPAVPHTTYFDSQSFFILWIRRKDFTYLTTITICLKNSTTLAQYSCSDMFLLSPKAPVHVPRAVTLQFHTNEPYQSFPCITPVHNGHKDRSVYSQSC
ncbi:TLD domain-containing protein 2 [Platysternon megacephalum]|uniref:TLD domain-containing protein 2 n=1 Tax=Platysternon megacephalum TaxID=55544 RepID=A0A4D9EEK4_9SAUR|nr:TLD domain-containing protein 2 [Platysternon megacephalum]